MNERYRWRLLKRVTLNEVADIETREQLGKDIDKALDVMAEGGSLYEQMDYLSVKWGSPVLAGIRWLRGEDNSLAIPHLDNCLRMSDQTTEKKP
jgi:hypothetical protein